MGRNKHKKSSNGNHGNWQSNLPKQQINSQENMKVNKTIEVPGLMACIFEHEIKETKVRYEWLGPKISREVWNEVLSFLRWTYDTTKSEAQVRLYVNSATREWKAWAFPQKGKTGMTTKEITMGEEGYDQTELQRAQFGDGWLYYCTVHHHCSSSAFQSGTDAANEHDQDGLHVTVGHMDKDHYDIDARLYQSKLKLIDFDLSDFWGIATDFALLPKFIREMIPATSLKLIAKKEMGVPPPADYPFPEQWKLNLIIEVPPPAVIPNMVVHGHSYYPGRYSAIRPYKARSGMNIKFEGERAVKQLLEWLEDDASVPAITLNEVLYLVEQSSTLLTDEHCNILDIAFRNDVSLDFFHDCITDAMEDKAKKKSKVEKEVGTHKVQAEFDTDGGHHGYGADYHLGMQ